MRPLSSGVLLPSPTRPAAAALSSPVPSSSSSSYPWAHKYRREMSRIADNGTTTTLMEREGGSLLGQVGSLRKTQRSLRLQNKLVRMSMVVAGGYVLGWLPYAVVCMWATYGDYSAIPIEVRLAASLICKSATAYNPFIYYFMSEGFRADLRWLGRRVGLIKHPINGSTFHPSYRSFTRSSIKKSRDRTRENSMQTNASRKDSNSTCLTSPNLGTPSTPLSPFTSPDTGDDPPVHLLSNPISISSSPRISNSCLRLSSSSLQQMEFIKSQSQITRQRKTEKPLSATDFLTDKEILKNFNPRRRIVNMTCDVDPLQYPCRRSVSFSMTPEASLHVVPTSPDPTDKVEEKPKRTLRSHSLYGSRSGKIIKTYPRRKPLRDSFMNTRV
ncbi:Opsin 5-like 2 [Homarus americanus]|uniref:Opsin 5-like 2 n=1 Tax=Homarus americanus TaxID=6706 RepID=A0A8J5MZ42_HOMAM|nr:Opsin 5-like 2 [Homarus americanus]